MDVQELLTIVSFSWRLTT